MTANLPLARVAATGIRRRPGVRMACTAILLAVLFLPAAAGADGSSIFVNQASSSCSDTGPGTASQPYCTIGAAAAQATAGTTVFVAAGTYREQVSPKSGAQSSPVTFVGAAGATVTGSGQQSSRGFYIASKSWVTIQGFTVTGTPGDGFYVSKSSNISLIGNRVSFAGQPSSGKTAKGINLTSTDDSLVKDNIVDHNTSFGIYVVSGSTRNQVVGNQISSNASVYTRAASGIRLHSAPGNTISSNVSHDNEDSGIELVTGSNNNLVVNNVSYGNGDHGIDNLDATGQRIVSNSVYDNVTAGINVEGTSPGATLANNISVDNGIASPRTTGNIRVDSTSRSGTTMDFDLVKLRVSGTMIEWGTSNYATLAAFVAATGQETHGLQADPRWGSPANGDFHLTAGSPGIDSANSGASGAMVVDVEGHARVDDPSTPDTGIGPRTYDDRGAYEFAAVSLDHIVISPSSATITAGGSQTYAAQGFDASNNSLGDVTASTTFSISPNGSCSGNVCTATTSGPHTVTGNDAGKTSTSTLAVTAGALHHLVLSPASATIAAGGSQAYTAEGQDQYNNSLGDVTAGTTFSIAPNGSCTGASCGATVAGAHTVTGTNGGKTGTASLQVGASSLDHIVISPSSATISAGGSQAYTAQGFDSFGNTVGDVTAFTTFLVSPNGSCTGNVCTATAAGEHTVTGNDGGKTSASSLTVTAAALDHLVLSPSSATITSGDSQAYTAEGRDQYNNSLGDVTASATFSISPNGACTGASCTATAAGVHTVTGDDGGKTGTASLQVMADTEIDHIVISPSSATISAGGSQAYTAEGFDASNNSLGDVTASTTFSISPNGSCIGSTCTATAAGTHTVGGNNGGKTSNASLTVNAGTLDHLVLSPASATITAGGSQAYTAEGRDQYNNPLGDVTASATFTISPDGSCTGATCTATESGTHTVTGDDGGKTGTASLQVTQGSVLDHIVISPSSATISAGGSQAYTAEGFDASNNSLGDVTASTTFTVSPNGSCTGSTCTATAAGPHTVAGNNSGKTSGASLLVTAGPLDHLALLPATATITSGGSQAYTADGRDQYDNSLGDVTASTTFSISPDGSCTGATCTATATGAHTVTGTRAGKTGSASLQVGGGGLDRIVISPSSATISAGGSQTYTAQGFDASNNSLGDVTAFTTFSISPEGACVGNVCTAPAGGPHTVTGSNSGKTSSASLSVSFVKNSGFESDTTGWNTSGSGSNIALSRVAGGHSGSWTAQLRNTGSVASTCTLNDSPDWVKPTSAGTFTGTMWARADTAGAALKLRFREYVISTGSLVGTAITQVTLTTSWQQVSVSYTVGSPGTTLDFNAYVSSAAPGTCFYADDVAVLLP